MTALRVDPLTRAYDTQEFSSGAPELDRWLQQFALIAEAASTAHTYVLVEQTEGAWRTTRWPRGQCADTTSAPAGSENAEASHPGHPAGAPRRRQRGAGGRGMCTCSGFATRSLCPKAAVPSAHDELSARRPDRQRFSGAARADAPPTRALAPLVASSGHRQRRTPAIATAGPPDDAEHPDRRRAPSAESRLVGKR